MRIYLHFSSKCCYREKHFPTTLLDRVSSRGRLQNHAEFSVSPAWIDVFSLNFDLV